MPKPIETNTILIVDDLQVNRIIARAYLEMLGWNVDECDGGKSALDYFETHTPECVLLDIRMPHIDGIKLVKILRQIHPLGTVKIVAYTAHAIKEEVEVIRSSGFDAVLIKPVTLKDVALIFKKPEDTLI
jgi:two-component system chemotaxis response regulator CheY